VAITAEPISSRSEARRLNAYGGYLDKDGMPVFLMCVDDPAPPRTVTQAVVMVAGLAGSNEWRITTAPSMESRRLPYRKVRGKSRPMHRLASGEVGHWSTGLAHSDEEEAGNDTWSPWAGTPHASPRLRPHRPRRIKIPGRGRRTAIAKQVLGVEANSRLSAIDLARPG